MKDSIRINDKKMIFWMRWTIIVLVLFIVIEFISAAPITDYANDTWISDSAYNDWWCGTKVTLNYDASIINITRMNNSLHEVECGIFDASYALLANSTFINDICTINYNATKGTTYCLAGRNGTTHSYYTNNIRRLAVSKARSGTAVNFTGTGCVNNITDSNAWAIASVTTDEITPPIGNKTLYDDLLAYYDFNNISGNTSEDFSIYDNYANISGTERIRGIIGYGRNITQPNSQIKINTINAYIHSGNSDITINLWFMHAKQSHPPIAGEDLILSYRPTGTNPLIGYVIYNDTLKIFERDSAGNNRDTGVINQSINVSDNEWHMLTIVHGVTSTKTYLDGDLIKDMSGTMPNDFIITGGTYPFISIGNEYLPPPGLLNGSIDELGVWNRSLNEDNITLLYNDSHGYQMNFSEIEEEVSPLSFYYPQSNINETYYNATEACLVPTYNSTYFEWETKIRDTQYNISSIKYCPLSYDDGNCIFPDNFVVYENHTAIRNNNSIGYPYYFAILYDDALFIRYEINSSYTINVSIIGRENCTLVCTASWRKIPQECVNGLSLINYSQQDSCWNNTNIPSDNGEYESCYITQHNVLSIDYNTLLLIFLILSFSFCIFLSTRGNEYLIFESIAGVIIIPIAIIIYGLQDGILTALISKILLGVLLIISIAFMIIGITSYLNRNKNNR